MSQPAPPKPLPVPEAKAASNPTPPAAAVPSVASPPPAETLPVKPKRESKEKGDTSANVRVFHRLYRISNFDDIFCSHYALLNQIVDAPAATEPTGRFTIVTTLEKLVDAITLPGCVEIQWSLCGCAIIIAWPVVMVGLCVFGNGDCLGRR